MIDIKNRITEDVNRSRLALEARRSVAPLFVAVVGVVVAALCTVYVASNVGQSLYTDSANVAFTVTDARGVVGGGRQEIRFRGIPAGVIEDVELRDGHAVIAGKLYSRFGRLYRDARVTLRPNTALEDMSIDVLDRGTPPAGLATDRAPLPVAQADVSEQVEDTLQVFRPETRANLGALLRELGNGLGGRGDDLEQAFVQAVPFVRQAASLSEQLSRRTDLTRKLITRTAGLAGELARRRSELRTLATAGGQTLRALQDESTALDDTLRQLPPTLTALDSGLTAVRGVVPDVNRALVDLRPGVRALPAGLTAAERLATRALPTLRRLREPVRRLLPLSRTLRPLSSSLRLAVARLAPQLPALDYVTRSVAGCSVALQGFFQWTPSVTKFDDAHGPAVRGDFAIGVDDTSFAKDPNVRPSPSCAPGGPVGGEPGPAGNLLPTPAEGGSR